MKIKIITSIFIFILITACSTGLNKRSKQADEFLIEKKNPLVMPPDINELPQPKEHNEEKNEDESFKEVLQSKGTSNPEPDVSTSKNLQESIIKKIEQ